MHCKKHWRSSIASISGLVAEYIVAIDVTRVRFPADAKHVGFWTCAIVTLAGVWEFYGWGARPQEYKPCTVPTRMASFPVAKPIRACSTFSRPSSRGVLPRHDLRRVPWPFPLRVQVGLVRLRQPWSVSTKKDINLSLKITQFHYW